MNTFDNTTTRYPVIRSSYMNLYLFSNHLIRSQRNTRIFVRKLWLDTMSIFMWRIERKMCLGKTQHRLFSRNVFAVLSNDVFYLCVVYTLNIRVFAKRNEKIQYIFLSRLVDGHHANGKNPLKNSNARVFSSIRPKIKMQWKNCTIDYRRYKILRFTCQTC